MDRLLNNEIVKYPIKSQPKPVINYERLKQALEIDGLSDKNKSTMQANQQFINTIKAAYGDNTHKTVSDTSSTRSSIEPVTKINKKANPSEPELDTHDVKLYTRPFHPIKKETADDKPIKRRLTRLKQLCIKPPFRRTTEEVDEIYQLLQTISQLSNQIEDDLLKLLANVIQYESHNQSEIPLFGNKAFYIILSGSVKPLSYPWIHLLDESVDQFTANNSSTKLNKQDFAPLYPGFCFGTLEDILLDDNDEDDHDNNTDEDGDNRRTSKILISQTESEYCELLFITTSYFRKISQKYKTQQHADKLRLLHDTGSVFSVWPQQAQVQLAAILTWTKIPANTILCSEGEISPICAFIDSGECCVLRKLNVKDRLANDKEVYRQKQVLVGELIRGQTIGEVSLLDQTPMPHSIISTKPMKLIQFNHDKLLNLDDDVRLLLRQSCTAPFYDVTQEDVEKIYIQQKSRNDWTSFKESVISRVIETCGIRPGQGKWGMAAKSGSKADVY